MQSFEMTPILHADAFVKMIDQSRQTVDQDPASGAHYMARMDRTGDTKVMWSKDNAEEVEEAKAQFDRMKKKGFAAFKVEGKEGSKGEQMREFDETAERIIYVPALAGG